MTPSAPSTLRRVEVKYPHASCAALLDAVLKLGAQPQHAGRSVNSIYFDSAELRDHEDGEEGITPRSKLRLRWYGAPELRFPFVGQLERKSTEVSGRKKTVESLQAADLPELRALLSRRVPAWLRPELQVSYERSYFVLAADATRLTVDTHIRYRRCPALDRMGLAWAAEPLSVLEIKAIGRHAAAFEAIDLAEARFSKYSRGVVRLGT